MPDVFHTLVNYDLGLLKIIAGKWGVVLSGVTHDVIVAELTQQLTDPVTFSEVYDLLPDEYKKCMAVLASKDGKLPWNAFTRKYGSIRELGIARRDREMPYNDPISITESLWYYGLVGRAFLNIADQLQEYAYIPDELRNFINAENDPDISAIISPALRHEYRFEYPADDRILDHLTSYLAAIRSGREIEILKDEFKRPSVPECQALTTCAGLMDNKGVLNPGAIKEFLAIPRNEAFLFLYTKWLESAEYNELMFVPGIICEGAWKNDPLKTRQMFVGWLKLLNHDKWWNIDSFIAYIKQTKTDFQRPAGDYDSWIIRSKKTGKSLRGYEHWDEVDGGLIRYLINGPLHWLGCLDLGCSQSGHPPEAFRLSNISARLLSNQAPEGLTEEKGYLTTLRNGQITCPRDVPRATRYQLARFCKWLGVNDKGYLYQLTVDSLQNASKQGLQIDQLLALLSHHASSSLPKSLVASLERWAKSGIQASLKSTLILQVTEPEIMAEIRNSPIGRFLGEAINPTMVLVSPKAAEKVFPRLLELGYFCEAEEGVLSIRSNTDSNTDKMKLKS